MKMDVFKTVLKVNIRLGYFCKKICHQELSKIAQYDHTVFGPQKQMKKTTCHAERVRVALALHRDRLTADGRTAADYGRGRDRDGVRPGDHKRVHVDPELKVLRVNNDNNI